MAKKKTAAKPSKKASAGGGRSAPAKAKAPQKAAAPRATVAGSIRRNKPPQFATFEEARGATLDALIHSIEEAERLLSVAKRAQSIEELPKLP